MNWQFGIDLLDGFGHTLWRIAPTFFAMAAAFTALSWVSPGNGGRPWWTKRGLITDLSYWLIIPIFTRYARIGLTVALGAYLLGVRGTEAIIKFYEHGHGPLSTLPILAQVAIYVVASDFMLYWIHRGFHRGIFWKYHAVHHASEDLEWTSAARFHPVNLLLGTVLVDAVLLFCGISPDVFLYIGSFDTFSSAFVHANLNWTLGPLKYIVAGPVFHRWHHTAADEGGEKNFAGTFSIWDVMFGTFYMPKGALPQQFGIEERDMPEGFGRQFLYPFAKALAR